MAKMKVLITGVTGLLGRNIFFELIKQNLDELDSLEMYILGRRTVSKSLDDRLWDILFNDGVDYIYGESCSSDALQEFFEDNIHPIEIDLDEETPCLDPDDLNLMKSGPIDYVIHVAAMTDIRSTAGVAYALHKSNVGGTQRLLEMIDSFDVKELIYIGSAYSCGNATGVLQPDEINQNKGFRNPYEKTKLEAEMAVRQFSKKTGLRCRYFRPSTICGRLIEHPIGRISKFDVFNEFAAFLLRLKMRALRISKPEYSEACDLNIRFCYNSNSGLNIVPADYCAKVIYQVVIQESSGDSYHLVNNQETPHSLYIPLILETLNITGWKHVETIPSDQNKLEGLLYKTVGQIYIPYVTSNPMFFDTSNLDSVLNTARLTCPPVDKNNFLLLIEYAKRFDFGLSLAG